MHKKYLRKLGVVIGFTLSVLHGSATLAGLEQFALDAADRISNHTPGKRTEPNGLPHSSTTRLAIIEALKQRDAQGYVSIKCDACDQIYRTTTKTLTKAQKLEFADAILEAYGE